MANDLARWQFATTSIYHFFFVPVTIGLAFLVAVLQTAWYRTDNPDYKYEEVSVDTFRGVVQLSGFVNTTNQKVQADQIARTVPGVKDVLNNIIVKGRR